MFKNATLYAIGPDWNADLTAMEQSLSSAPFRHCGPTDAETFGFVPPRGPGGDLVESIHGQRIACFQLETKSVPASAINRELGKRVAAIEASGRRRVGRKESRELKEQITFDLLPHAFPKTSRVLVWFDLQHRRLVLDTASQSKADTATTALTQALSGLHLSLLDTSTPPQAAMTQWLAGEDDAWPTHFAPGHEVELKADDGSKATVKFDRHHLDDKQMRLHIEQGKLPTRLGLDWEGRVGFVLTEGLQLRKIAFLDGVATSHDAQDNSGFDADAAIATAELGQLITDLIAALGGQAHH